MRSLISDLIIAAAIAAAALALVRAPRWMLVFVVAFLRLRVARELAESAAAAAARVSAGAGADTRAEPLASSPSSAR